MAFRAIIFFLLPALLFSIDYSPWIRTALYPENQLRLRFEDGKNTRTEIVENCVKATILPPFEVQGQVRFSGTKKNGFGLSSLDLAGAYLIYNEEVGDPFSLKATAVIGGAFNRFSHDNALFEPGPGRLEGHLSAGREGYCRDIKQYSVYADFGFGLALKGPTWFSAIAEGKVFLCDPHALLLKAEGLYQFAGKQGLAMLVGYEYSTIDYGTFTLELGGRVAARKLPHACLTQVTWSIPFGLGI